MFENESTPIMEEELDSVDGGVGNDGAAVLSAWSEMPSVSDRPAGPGSHRSSAAGCHVRPRG